MEKLIDKILGSTENLAILILLLVTGTLGGVIVFLYKQMERQTERLGKKIETLELESKVQNQENLKLWEKIGDMKGELGELKAKSEVYKEASENYKQVTNKLEKINDRLEIIFTQSYTSKN